MSGGRGSGPLVGADAPAIPRGDLRSARVVDGPAGPLRAALDAGVTGYLTLEPQSALLLDGAARGVVTLVDGVPVLAYEAGSDAGGADALAALATVGPVRASVYALPERALAAAHDCGALRVAPGAPARDLADDPRLARRTREAAPADRGADDAGAHDALAAFLADEERVAAIREEAREEAESRAREWGLTDELAGDDGEEPNPGRRG